MKMKFGNMLYYATLSRFAPYPPLISLAMLVATFGNMGSRVGLCVQVATNLFQHLL
jgi:hypothetical protein